MNAKFPVVRDAIERIVATFAAVVLGAATTDVVGWQDALKLDNWKAWGLAGVAAAWTLLKTIVAAQIAKRGGQAVSASLDPAVALQPTDTVR